MLITIALLGEALVASIATVGLNLSMCSGVAHSSWKRRKGPLADKACHAEVKAACLFAKYIAPMQAFLYLLQVMCFLSLELILVCIDIRINLVF